MDAFFASIEQRDNPELRGKPLAVGGSRDRGVVAAASYEARQFGIHSAMPSKTAYRKCPNIIFVPPRFDVYKSVSKQIMDVFREFTDLVEPLSLDEAYLDVTENKINLPSATLIARQIKKRIKEETELTASAGISMNKFLAKIASDMDKPDGIYLITPDIADAFVDTLPIEKFFGVGKKTAEKMKSLGIFYGKDLKGWELHTLTKQFGKAGRYYYNIAHGKDDRAVQPNRIRKSIGAERTFETDLTEPDAIREALVPIIESVDKRLTSSNASGKTVTLKIKFFDFVQQTRSKTVPEFVGDAAALWPIVNELLESPEFPESPIRLLGVSLSNLNNAPSSGPPGQMRLEF